MAKGDHGSRGIRHIGLQLIPSVNEWLDVLVFFYMYAGAASEEGDVQNAKTMTQKELTNIYKYTQGASTLWLIWITRMTKGKTQVISNRYIHKN